MAGFNLFNTNTTTSTTQSSTFGISNTSNLFNTNTSGFGALGGTSNVSLGTPIASSNIQFGLQKTQTPQNLTFGSSSPQANVAFCAPSSQSTTLGTGGTLPSFGSLKPQTTTPVSTNLFGVTTSTAQTPLPGSSATTTTNPVFGGLTGGSSLLSSANTVAQTTSQPSLFTLSTSTATTTTASTLTFGGLGSTTQTSFGITPSTTTATTSTTLGGLSFGSTSKNTISFGGLGTSSAPATTATGLLGSFGANATTTASGMFSWQKPTQETTTISTASVGLGGVDHTAVSTAQSTANTIVSAKEQMLPNEIQQTVVTFKEYIKTQKNLSSEVARTSAEPLTKLTQQISALNNLILTLGSILSQQKFTAEKIKLETIKSLNDYELAQKIKDSPVASEERMYAIRKYFIEKISAFEESTKTLQEKIEYVYQHVITLPQENSLSAEALKLIVKKLHDSFVVIGARAYKLHNDMQLLKVQYLTLRNQYVKDNSSIAFSLNKEIQLPFSEKSKSNVFSLEGPNPFSRTANGSFNSLLLASQHRNLSAITPSKEWNVGGCSTSFDQSNSELNLSGGQQFNLQKPPIGNKRGKR